jgi:hypothetical protein
MDDLETDVKTYSTVTQIAIEELTDAALSGNIARRHHLESALECFDSIKVLIEAEKIVKELLVVDEELELNRRDEDMAPEHP